MLIEKFGGTRTIAFPEAIERGFLLLNDLNEDILLQANF